ncbi:MAG: EAL domain-containing protein [Gammaproteobacteria bacterium]|nr:EAL domain-containing protein [Gammaproteobacteria bacterium]
MTEQPIILVVDDNPANLRVMEGILRQEGYQVRSALGGKSALRAAATFTPELILLDIRMPEINGYEVCRELKKTAQTAHIPIIFISALQDIEDKVAAFHAGGQDYISKPFQTDEVIARVRTHVELSQSRRQLAHSNQQLETLVALRTEALQQSNQQLQQSMLQEQALRQLLALSHRSLSCNEYLQQALELLSNRFHWLHKGRKAAIFLTRDRGHNSVMELVAQIGISPQQQQSCSEIRYGECVCGVAARDQRVMSVDMAESSSPLKYLESRDRCRIAIPILANQLTLGVLMYTVEDPGELPPDIVDFLQQVANVIAMSVAHHYADDQIAYMAFHDKLTGLLNRTSLNERLTFELERCSRHQNALALLFIDLDHFKHINDALGHEVGDYYLKTISQRLSTSLRIGDLLYRWGSDEFVLLSLDLGSKTEKIAPTIDQLVQSVSEDIARPVAIANGQELQLNASIGIAIHPGDGDTSEILLQHAELAMFRGKQGGRNRHHYFHTEMQIEADQRMSIGHDLRLSLEKENFELYYQPQIDSDGNLSGAEALIRWNHPQRGLVMPGDFIHLAEDLGYISAIGEWVMATAAACLQQCIQLYGKRGLPLLSVNISARHFHEKDFVQRCLTLLEESGVSPEHLELEVTESLLLTDIQGAQAKIAALRKAGLRFALDDFGTGYSSLSYLKSLPVQKIKIDRSFVTNVHQDPRNAAIVHTIINLARNLGMTTIAEGVESRAELEFLLDAGCNLIQGYYYSRPLSNADFYRSWLELDTENS